MESQLEFYDDYRGYVKKREEALSALVPAQEALRNEIYKDGALSSKVKHLMALAVGLQARCIGCIIGHTRFAVEAGATKDEIVEVISVAYSMGGSMGSSESWRVIKVLEELGKW
jgi:AhpD family alkylhydroperoxidase